MKAINTKLKKILIIVISAIIIAIVVVIFFISVITKYLVEKYDVKYTGREITVGLAYVNPFTGYVHFSNLKIYEYKNDSVFISAKGVSANFAMFKMLSKTVEITELALNQPKGIIIQKEKDFNFNDLIKKFTPEKTDTIPSQIHFNILTIKIINGEFYYCEKVIPVNYFIKEVNIESTGILWNSDTIGAKFYFLSGTGSGKAEGNFTINFKTLNYRLSAIVNKFDLKFLKQYLKDLINYGNFTANLDADIKATGNFNEQEDINIKGLLAINDFHFGKNIYDDYASFEKLVLKIEALSPKNHQYLFDSLLLNRPFFKYERYDYLDNIEMMFGKSGANISAARAGSAPFNLILEIADYIKLLAKNFFRSDYNINKLSITKGCFKFNDYSITEKFSIEANPLNVVADSVNKNHKRVNIFFKSGINPYGNISVNLSINPKDSSDFDMKYNFQRLSASMFNPYLINYTSYPLDRGTIELNGIWNVRNSIIQSTNHFIIIDPRVSKRLKNKNANWIPMPLIMSFTRDRFNVIDYEIPITGNLKNPKFHLHDVIIDVIENIFVKPPTTPYRMMVKNVETEIEKSLSLKWKMRQCSLLPNQERFVNKIADFLKDNPQASIAVYPMQYIEKEKEYISFFEAKKKYFLLINNHKNAKLFSEKDSVKVDKMSVKDSLFVLYLNEHTKRYMVFTIQEKCNNFVGLAIINAKYKQLNKEREDAFMLHFKNNALEKRVKIYEGKNNIPYNGFSFYKIDYKGELPKSLIEAYQQMNELNNEVPRNKFEKERNKIRSLLKQT